MNATNENEKKTETREARTNPPGDDSYDAEVAPAQEGSDSRETPERGYGWGVSATTGHRSALRAASLPP